MVAWLAVALWIVLGLLAALGARSRGRSPAAWFFLGTFLGWWSLFLLYLLPPVASEERTPPPVQPPANKPPVPSLDQSKGWFFIDQAKTVCGPVTGAFMKEKWKAGQLLPSSWIWSDTILVWKKISQEKTVMDWLEN